MLTKDKKQVQIPAVELFPDKTAADLLFEHNSDDLENLLIEKAKEFEQKAEEAEEEDFSKF